MSDWREMLSADVLTLGMAADQARRALPDGGVATYVRVHAARPDMIGATVPEGASEVRLYAAAPDALEDAVAQVRALRTGAGRRRVTAFSFADLESRGWTAAADALRRLVDAGLDDVAELPADRVSDLEGAIAALRAAGADPQRITMAQPMGERRMEIIGRVQQVIANTALRRFAPLPRAVPVEKPTTGYEDVRAVALARLALGAASIEVDWTLSGAKLAQVALTFGADHLDAVPATEDPALGRRRATVDDVERNIRAAGFEPREYRARGARTDP